MNRTKKTLTTFALALMCTAQPALADQAPPSTQDEPSTRDQPHTQAPPKASGQGKTMAEPAMSDMQSKRSMSDIMKISQNAMTHVAAAQRAIAKGDKKAAKSAIDQSQRALKKLYDAPPMQTVLNEIDEAIVSAQRGKQALKALDLAPLAASVRRYQAYIDPSVAAGIDEAAQKAEQGDATGTADALRLARNRMAVDVAFLPVEEAYVRVLAAETALAEGDMKRAGKILQSVPIVIAEVQVGTPLVPVRFKLNAAALAAQEGNWKRSQTLISEATNEMQSFEKQSKQSPMAQEVSTLVDEMEKLDRQMGTQSRPDPEQIRELANRTLEIGA